MKKLIALTIANIIFAIVMVHKVHAWRENNYIEPWDSTAIVHQA